MRACNLDHWRLESEEKQFVDMQLRLTASVLRVEIAMMLANIAAISSKLGSRCPRPAKGWPLSATAHSRSLFSQAFSGHPTARSSSSFFARNIYKFGRPLLANNIGCKMDVENGQHLLMSTENGGSEFEFTELHEVISKLKLIIPLEYASDWDNVGLLVEPSGIVFVKKILLTIDLTEKVLDEAIAEQVQLIFAYHPPLFRPFKRLTQNSWKERIAIRCIENGIAVFSPHTALDAMKSGINDWLLSPFDCDQSNIKPIEPVMVSSNQLGNFDYNIHFKTQGDDVINVINSKFSKSKYRWVKESENGFNILCNIDLLPQVLEILGKNEISFKTISSTPKLPLLEEGMGRIAKLKSPVSIKDVYEKVKKHLGLEHLRLALSNIHMKESKISTIAVCAGSGGSILQQTKADIFITGEMSHHEVLDAVHKGTSVILCEHTNTERGYLKLYKATLEELLKLEVHLSEHDSDPNKIV